MKKGLNYNNVLIVVLVIIMFILGGILYKNQKLGQTSGSPTASSEISPHYLEYSEAALTKAQKEGRVVLFFWAPWCNTCSALDDDLRKNSRSLQDDVTVLKVNFDTQKDLKARYKVLYQHTLVQIDKNGNEITKWIGGNVDLIKEQLL